MQLCLLAIFLSTVLCSNPFRPWIRYFTNPRRYPPILRSYLSAISHNPPITKQIMTPNRPKMIFNLETVLVPRQVNMVHRRYKIEVAYIQEILGIDEGAAKLKHEEYCNKYDSVPNGLMVEKGIHSEYYDCYLAKNFDYQVIAPNRALAANLKDMNSDIIVFSNASLKHTERIIEILGIGSSIHVVFASNPREIKTPLEGTFFERDLASIEHHLETDPKLITYLDVCAEYLTTAREDFGWNLIEMNFLIEHLNRVGSVFFLSDWEISSHYYKN
jgi:hypothetical protein